MGNTDDMADEYNIWLDPHDMDHLRDGAPVYKPISTGGLVVIRPKGWNDE